MATHEPVLNLAGDWVGVALSPSAAEPLPLGAEGERGTCRHRDLDPHGAYCRECE